MATFSKFEDLEIWQLARHLAHEIFLTVKESEVFSKDFRLKDQINASSGAIMDNIAEGFERDGRKEFIQFLSIAKASGGEVMSQLYRALNRTYITKEKFESLYNKMEVLCKKIGGFMKYLSHSNYSGTKYK